MIIAITAVIDTNVFASGLVRRSETSPPVQIIDRWRAGLFSLVLSEEIVAELARTLDEPYFRLHLTSAQRSTGLAILHSRGKIVPLTVQVHGVATHQEDDLIVSTALSGQAQYLVTGDKKLQELQSFQSLTIVSPRQFMELLRLTEER